MNNSINKPINNPRIKILQYMYGDVPYFPYSEWINRRYCKKHGIQYVIRREKPRTDRHICWHKIPMILDELHSCDYLLFMDADAVFYSHELTIETELISQMEGRSILMAQDCGDEANRWHPGLPNSGVILVQVNDRVREIISEWDHVSEIDEETRWNWPPEQLALWRHILPKYKEDIKTLIDYYLLQGRWGQYIRHLCLISNESRVERFKAIYSRLVKNSL